MHGTGTNDQLDRARRVIADLRRKLTELQAASTSEAIAVVGMACRFPGEATNCDSYWQMIRDGRNAVRPIPPERARDMAAVTLRPAALIDDIETFDAAFFDIAPREAAQMDPQQRLFLEVAWEALEDAGQTRSGLAGSRTGIFVGVHNHSSGYFELQTADAERLNEYTALGSGHDVIAGRLAYFLDLRGASAVINTACSSSLVAVHMACQSLSSRDCNMAVAGGVNLILGPNQSRIVGLGGMLSNDGHCKTFDARADGYGRGEGCGALVLKRLADTHPDRDRVLAVIRASAVNQDGRTNGLTAPNGLSQQALLRRTLARAGLDAARIGYIEAHGTGTALGDPIEVEALASVYGAQAEGAQRCGLGSAKANINHLEGAAGVAGLIKAILAIRARVIPPVAGFERLNPHLCLERTRFFIPAKPTEWHSEAPRVAAVSAFGWSGVNAHLLLEEAPVTPLHGLVRPTVIMISAADPASLSVRAATMADAVERLADNAMESFAWTATARRSHYPQRLAVAGASCVELAKGLRQGTHRSAAGKVPLALGFLIGDDIRAADMFGPELMRDEPSFRNAVESCAATLQAVAQADAAAALTGDWTNGAAPPALRCFTFTIGVAALLAHWGIRPAAIAGWGVGALAENYLGGGMSLAEAVRRVLSAGQPSASATAGASAFAVDRLARARVSYPVVDHTVRLDTLDWQAAPVASARLRLMQILAGLVNLGMDPDWEKIFSPAAQIVSLPASPYRRRRHWVTQPPRLETLLTSVEAGPPREWLFETRWRPHEAPVQAPEQSHLDNWLILGHGEADRLAGVARAAGAAVRVQATLQPDDLRSHNPGRWIIVDLRSLETEATSIAAAALHAAKQVVDLDRILRLVPPGPEIKLWIATRGAQNVLPGAAPNLASAPLWGLSRSLRLSGPERWGGLVDLDPSAALDPERLYREIATDSDEEGETAFRSNLRYVNRLEPTQTLAPDTLKLDASATYLVTGAFGGIGPSLALWLARRGAKSLTLTSRSLGEDTDAHHPGRLLEQQLRQLGVDVRLERCDLGDPDAVAGLFERIRQAGLPLRGILHAAAAGIWTTPEIQEPDLVAAFRPKLDGTLALDQHSRALDLDFFVLFSSAAGVLGARGLGHYAAANAFLDALAAARRAQGLPALSIDWGLWGGRDDAAPDVQYFRRVGLNPMPPETALNAMARLMSAQAQERRDLQPLVASLDGERLWSALKLRGQAKFLSILAPDKPVRQTEVGRALIERLRHAPAVVRRSMLADVIASEVRNVLEMAAEDILSADRGFFDLGMDSLMMVTLRARLADLFGSGLPSTLTIDYPSIAALAGYFEAMAIGSDFAQTRSPIFHHSEKNADPSCASARTVEEMSDDEVAAALSAELNDLNLELLE